MNSPFIQSILHAATLIGNLSQSVTNGGSVLGTLQAPYLPQALPASTPWNDATVSNANPYTSAPRTAVVRNYTFNISRGYLSPDGVNRSMILINGQFPGPLIEANWGDYIQVTVNNKITGPSEGTSLHWHGILQNTTQWMDGVPAVGQCPISPGNSFTYYFQADIYGTSWYHSHYSAQYGGGILGPMVIHGPSSLPYDIDVGPIILTDWNHPDYYRLVQDTMASPANVPVSTNNLINGKMNYNCTLAAHETGLPSQKSCNSNAGLAKFRFQTGKVHRLRLINAGSDGIQRFTLDGHIMTVIANDFVPVQPYVTNVVTLGVGQRTDVLVNATDKANASFWMRSEIDPCSSSSSQTVALAAVYYPSANTSSTPKTTTTTYDGSICGNEPIASITPKYPIAAPANPATVQNLYISSTVNDTGHTLWQINSRSFRANYNHPVLLLANAGNVTYDHDPQWNVYNFGSNSSIRIILNNEGPNPHPFHLHGHNFLVVDEGPGSFAGNVQNPQNPQRRDTQIVQPYSYTVLDFYADNPGVWPLHCHIAWHVSAGLYINVMERPADIKKFKIPAAITQTCKDWAAFTNTTVPDEIDSGLRIKRDGVVLE